MRARVWKARPGQWPRAGGPWMWLVPVSLLELHIGSRPTQPEAYAAAELEIEAASLRAALEETR